MSCIKELQITSTTKVIDIPTLDKTEYNAIKGALARLGIEWDRKLQSHRVSKNTYKDWKEYCASGRLPKLNPNAFFPTPIEAVELMLAEYIDHNYIEFIGRDSPKSLRVLEPSAGTGRIATAARDFFGDAASIDTIEMLPENCEVLRKKGFDPMCMDFLDYESSEKYDYILMNPPFSVAGDKKAYMTHVLHAFTLLKPKGKIIAILPTNWLSATDARSKDFQRTIAEYASWEEPIFLEKGTFKASGTMIETMIAVFDNEKPTSEVKEFQGWPSQACWLLNLQTDALMTYDESINSLFRKCQEASSYDEAYSAYQMYFEASREILSTKGLFFLDSIVQPTIECILSYEYNDKVKSKLEEVNTKPKLEEVKLRTIGSKKQIDVSHQIDLFGDILEA